MKSKSFFLNQFINGDYQHIHKDPLYIHHHKYIKNIITLNISSWEEYYMHDLCCASGDISLQFKDSKKYIGVDFLPENICFAQDKYPDCNWICLPIIQFIEENYNIHTKFDINRKNIILLAECTYYFDSNELKKIFTKIISFKCNNYIMISFNTKKEKIDRVMMLLEKSPFKLIDVKNEYTSFYKFLRKVLPVLKLDILVKKNLFVVRLLISILDNTEKFLKIKSSNQYYLFKRC